MSVVKQLYQLQEIELELESKERALKQITAQLGESEPVVRARNKLALEEQRLQEFQRQQRSIEWEIDDLVNKLSSAEETLYSGRIRNPKELTGLQHEVEGWKTKRYQLEDKVLEMMGQAELSTQGVASLKNELKVLEAEWQSQQQHLLANLEQIKAMLASLQQKRELLLAEVDPQVIPVYQTLKKQKGSAVARVEQGVCQACRISLPNTEIQQARSGNLVRCGSCGRILFLA